MTTQRATETQEETVKEGIKTGEVGFSHIHLYIFCLSLSLPFSWIPTCISVFPSAFSLCLPVFLLKHSHDTQKQCSPPSFLSPPSSCLVTIFFFPLSHFKRRANAVSALLIIRQQGVTGSGNNLK